MTFENPQLEVDNLPSYKKSTYLGIEETYLKVMQIGSLIFSTILFGIIIGVLFAMRDFATTGTWILGLSIWFVICGISFLLVGPSFRQKGYAVRERDISYKTGLINRRITTIPFNRVQHCDIKQGVVSRYFGLSKLNVYTAGGAKSDLSIPGLAPSTAAKIMDFVLQKTLAYDEEE